MSLEIEHKYLVRKDLWFALHKPQGVEMRQAYIVASPDRVVRIRIADDKGFLTIKGPGSIAGRPEFEYSIPLADAAEMMKLSVTSVIEKTRYKIEFEGKTWEIDEFYGENDGLILAEIELTSPEEKYSKPAWIGEEVTADNRYYNAYLAEHPFAKW